MNVEFKTGTIFCEIIEKNVKIAKEMGMSDRVIYSTFNHYSVLKAKQIASYCQAGFLYTDDIIDLPSKQSGVNFLHLPAIT